LFTEGLSGIKQKTTDQVGQEIKNGMTFNFQEQEFIYYTGYGWMINDGRKTTKPEPAYGCPKNYRNSQTYICKENNFMGKPRRRVYSNESSDDEGIVEDECNLKTTETSLMPKKAIGQMSVPVSRKHNAFLNHKFKEFARLRELDPEPHPGDTVIIGTRAPISAGKYEYTAEDLWWRIEVPKLQPKPLD
jgi:hypothetical protein